MDYNVLKKEMREFLGDIVNSKKLECLFVENPNIYSFIRKCIMFTKKYSGLNDYLEFFLKKYHDNININESNKKGSTLLHLAVQNSKHESTERTVEILIDAGINIDIQDKQGDTALHTSINYIITGYETSTIETIKILINSCANVNLQNLNGETPLHQILNFRHFANNNKIIIKMLIRAGADIFNLKNTYGFEPIKYFSAQLIKACEIDIDAQTIGIISGKLTKRAII